MKKNKSILSVHVFKSRGWPWQIFEVLARTQFFTLVKKRGQNTVSATFSKIQFLVNFLC